MTQMSEEPVQPSSSERQQQYRTRSGRVVRQVPRYEPDENTIFDDEESSGSESSGSDVNLTDDSYNTSDTGSLSSSDSSGTDDTESLSSLSDAMSLNTSTLNEDEEDLGDVLDWDRLTDDAHTEDESSEEEDFYDDDEEDTETL
jgi:hypothetical protein